MSTFDPLAFFDGDIDPAAAAAAPEPAAEAPAAAEPAAAPAPAAETPAEDKFEGAPAGYVPLAALHEARQKARTLQEAVEAAKNAAKPVPSEPAAPAAQAKIPAPGTPEHGAYLQEQLVTQQINSNLNLSEARFTVANGLEATKALQDWVEKQDVYFFQRVLNTADPYAEAKKAYDIEQEATAFKAIPQDELKAFKDWQKAQADAKALAATTPAVVAPSVAAAAKKEVLTKPVSSGSIVNAPSAGGAKVGETIAAPGAAFDNIFN